MCCKNLSTYIKRNVCDILPFMKTGVVCSGILTLNLNSDISKVPHF